MFAIITDISPNFATVAAMVLVYDLAEAVDAMGDADQVVAVAPHWAGWSVGKRVRVDPSDFIADPYAAAA